MLLLDLEELQNAQQFSNHIVQSVNLECDTAVKPVIIFILKRNDWGFLIMVIANNLIKWEDNCVFLRLQLSGKS